MFCDFLKRKMVIASFLLLAFITINTTLAFSSVDESDAEPIRIITLSPTNSKKKRRTRRVRFTGLNESDYDDTRVFRKRFVERKKRRQERKCKAICKGICTGKCKRKRKRRRRRSLFHIEITKTQTVEDKAANMPSKTPTPLKKPPRTSFCMRDIGGDISSNDLSEMEKLVQWDMQYNQTDEKENNLPTASSPPKINTNVEERAPLGLGKGDGHIGTKKEVVKTVMFSIDTEETEDDTESVSSVATNFPRKPRKFIHLQAEANWSLVTQSGDLDDNIEQRIVGTFFLDEEDNLYGGDNEYEDTDNIQDADNDIDKETNEQAIPDSNDPPLTSVQGLTGAGKATLSAKNPLGGGGQYKKTSNAQAPEEELTIYDTDTSEVLGKPDVLTTSAKPFDLPSTSNSNKGTPTVATNSFSRKHIVFFVTILGVALVFLGDFIYYAIVLKKIQNDKGQATAARKPLVERMLTYLSELLKK